MQDIEPVFTVLGNSPQRLAACSTERARSMVALELAMQLGFLPIALVEHNGVSVLAGAVRCGDVFAVTQAITFRLGIRARLVEVEQALLHEAITIAYKGDGHALQSAALQLPSDEFAEERSSGKLLWMPSHAGAAKLFSELVEHGAARGASDIMIVPHADDCDVRFKINGEIHSWSGKRLSKFVHGQIVRRAKVLARLDPNVTSVPQDGSFEGARGIRARLSTLPTLHGENLVIRIVSARVRELEDLGLEIETRERCERWLSSASGLVIFGGPTGAGKSASLYACMGELSRRGLGVASVEDPVEIEIAGVIQSQVNAGGTFSQVVRAVLRQAPDVIVVGEVRDRETAAALIEAATTGHLALCSMHGGSISEILARFEHFGIPSTALAMVLRGIIVQRLLPRLCSGCRVVDLAVGGYREVGCSTCQHTGYDGRVLVTESYEHLPRTKTTIECVTPFFRSWCEALADLQRDGVISHRSAALVRW